MDPQAPAPDDGPDSARDLPSEPTPPDAASSPDHESVASDRRSTWEPL
jgi:hypothetical protein